MLLLPEWVRIIWLPEYFGINKWNSLNLKLQGHLWFQIKQQSPPAFAEGLSFVGVAGAEPYALNVFLSVIYRNDPNLVHLLVLILFGITNIPILNINPNLSNDDIVIKPSDICYFSFWNIFSLKFFSFFPVTLEIMSRLLRSSPRLRL